MVNRGYDAHYLPPQAFLFEFVEFYMHEELWLWTLLISYLFSRKHVKRLWAGNKHFLPLKFHNPSSSGSVVSLRRPISCTSDRAVWCGEPWVAVRDFSSRMLGCWVMGQWFSSCGSSAVKWGQSNVSGDWWMNLQWDRDAGHMSVVTKVFSLLGPVFFLNPRRPLQGTLAGK